MRDFDPAIRLLENWHSPLLPEFIYENIINQLIMPKLTSEVDSWNPRTDTEMIHQWLHPWLPLLGERLDPLYVNIRQKFRLILQNWGPTDSQALDILRPWKNVIFLMPSISVFIDNIDNLTGMLSLFAGFSTKGYAIFPC